MTNIVSTTDLQNFLVIAGSFIVGVVAKAHLPFGKNNNDTLDALTKDFEAMKALYDAKVDEIRRKDEQYLTLKEDYLQARARVTSYENFLQSRSLQTDNLLKQVPGVLQAIADHLDISIKEVGIDGHESAHSQVK